MHRSSVFAVLFVLSACSVPFRADEEAFNQEQCKTQPELCSNEATGGSAGAGGSGAGNAGTSGTSGVAGTAGSGGTAGASTGPNCLGVAANCGPTKNDDCCSTATTITGGEVFYRFCNASLTDPKTASPDNNYVGDACTMSWPASVSSFRLDKYEVTVGRFRAFVEGYDAWRAAGHPAAGEGGDPNVTSVTTSWDAAWTASLPDSAAVFKDGMAPVFCSSDSATWVTTATADSETKAINCVNWYQANAFCLWDGGWLPTEAEWMYAAAGGQQNRVYPWSNPASSTTTSDNYANYGNFDSGVEAVGSHHAGKGRWDHEDLGGNVWEWTWDAYNDAFPGTAGVTCDNCANVTDPYSKRVDRGGSWVLANPNYLCAAYRSAEAPAERRSDHGFRCARSAP